MRFAGLSSLCPTTNRGTIDLADTYNNQFQYLTILIVYQQREHCNIQIETSQWTDVGSSRVAQTCHEDCQSITTNVSLDQGSKSRIRADDS